MMRSLYSGVSGLQNHQTRMDVIGNNVSNVNTTGFKKGRVNFQDMLSQNLQGAARPNEERGGVNPKQVGLGMMVASIDTIHTQGSLQSTGVTTDLAIMGNGFFVLRDGSREFYSRAGNFTIDRDSFMVNPANGRRVQGWMAQNINGSDIINAAADVEDLLIPIGAKDPARQTANVDLICNLDKRTPILPANPTPEQILQSTYTLNKTIYDSFGEEHQLVVSLTRVPGTENSWQGTVTIDPDAAVANNLNTDVGAANNADNLFVVNFDNQGRILSATDTAGDLLNVDQLSVQVAYDITTGTPDAAGALPRETFNLNLGVSGQIDEAVTQFSDQSTTKAVRQDGYGLGYMERIDIDQEGIVTGIFSNGNTRQLAQVALASFANEGGLQKSGANSYQVSNNSGDPNISPVGVAGKGVIISGSLEMSNVDLAEQFTDMIVTQRGFQANSRSITTSDQMLQELLSLKR